MLKCFNWHSSFFSFSRPIANQVDLNGNDPIEVDDDEEDDNDDVEGQVERDVWKSANPSGRVNPRYIQHGSEQIYDKYLL